MTPATAVRSRNGHVYKTGILGRRGNIIVPLGRWTLVAGYLGEIAVIDIQNFLGIAGGILGLQVQGAHLSAVLGPGTGPGVIGSPGVGEYTVGMPVGLVHANKLYLKVIGIVQVVPAPAQRSIYRGNHLITAWGTVPAPVRSPPGASDGSGVVVHDGVADSRFVHNVRVAGQNIYCVAVQKRSHLRRPLNIVGFSLVHKADGTVLGKVDMGALGNVGEEPGYKAQGFLGISCRVVVGTLFRVFQATALE